MFGKLGALWNVFKQGEAVANPAAWKSGQITVTMLGGLFIAAVQVAKAFGYDINMDTDTATTIAGGIIAAVNFLLTITTSKTVGLPNKPANPLPEITAPVSRIDEATRKRAEQFIEDTYKG